MSPSMTIYRWDCTYTANDCVICRVNAALSEFFNEWYIVHYSWKWLVFYNNLRKYHFVTSYSHFKVLGILENLIGKNNWRNSQWHIYAHLFPSCRKHEGLYISEMLKNAFVIRVERVVGFVFQRYVDIVILWVTYHCCSWMAVI